jgi:chromosome partitioning protein
MKTVAFCNNKADVGKTTLVYHLAWMYQELGVNVVAMDLDPQADLTASFLEEEALMDLWLAGSAPRTIVEVIRPLLDDLGDLAEPELQVLGDHLALLPGNLTLSRCEERFADAWARCRRENPPQNHDAFRLMTAFYRAADRAAQARNAELVLIDIGASLDGLTRAALIASDVIVMPLKADFYSLQSLQTIGPAVSEWRKSWKEQLESNSLDLSRPAGEMRPAGYVIFSDQPGQKSQRWIERIHSAYHHELLGRAHSLPNPDAYHLGTLKSYRSLLALAQEARKPMFLLRPADGALGSHSVAVLDSFRGFKALAVRIAACCGIPVPAAFED